MTINSDGPLSNDIVNSMKLIRQDGTGVLPIKRINVEDHGGYIFRITIEGNRNYWLQFGDGTKIKMFPYDYRSN